MNSPNDSLGVARWYVLNAIGMATLCKDSADAATVAANADIEYPRHGPHVAVQLVPVLPGWKLVPFEPTAWMLDAGEDFDCSPTWRTANVWRAMVKAAPDHAANYQQLSGRR